MEPIAIARRYLRTWFLIDFISSVPLDYIILALSPDANITQMMHAGTSSGGSRISGKGGAGAAKPRGDWCGRGVPSPPGWGLEKKIEILLLKLRILVYSE